MNKAVQAQLRSAGWRPGRRVKLEGAQQAYRDADYQVWPELDEFLREFDHLNIRGEPLNPLTIDGADAAGSVDRDLAHDYERLAQTVLTPIGEYHVMTIFLGRDGKFWGGLGELFGCLSDNFFDLVDSILNRPGSGRLNMIVED